MAAYVIADVEVTDSAGFEEYKTAVPETIARYGGKYLARGGTIERAEGDWAPKRLTILQFESMAQAKRWYQSAEYQKLLQLRLKTTNSRLLFVEGL